MILDWLDVAAPTDDSSGQCPQPIDEKADIMNAPRMSFLIGHVSFSKLILLVRLIVPYNQTLQLLLSHQTLAASPLFRPIPIKITTPKPEIVF